MYIARSYIMSGSVADSITSKSRTFDCGSTIAIQFLNNSCYTFLS
jgi:hypothetical protein